jgi:hypothetical protein
LHTLKNGYIFVPTNKLKHKTMTKRELNTEAKIHHLARLEMMMLEERGIFISYKEAIKKVRNK